MHDLNPDPAIPLRLHQLFDDAVKQALFGQQAGPFLDWFREEVQRCGPELWPDAPAEALRGMAHSLGSALWNQLPLPRNRFRPEPLAKPERNERCPCGSGAKYKHCCARLPALPSPDVEFVWELALRHLPREQLREAIEQRQIPVMTLGALADEQLQKGNGRQAIALLEPLFEGDVASLDQRHAAVLNLLCNAYDEVHKTPAPKLQLLERLTAAPHKAMRANAWQRLASFRMDQGREDEAWRCFQEAQRADAADPDLAQLELLLLVARGEHARARERARFWLAQHQRLGIEDPDRLEFLAAAIRDPAAAFAELGRSHRDPRLVELETLFKASEGLELPAYRPVPVSMLDADDPEALADLFWRRFRGMGIAEDQIERQLPKLQADLRKMRDKPAAEPVTPEEPTVESRERMLGQPRELAELEERWRACYPLGKPVSTQPLTLTEAGPWSESDVGQWMQFLKGNPLAFNSLDILDDLVMALDAHGEDQLPGVYEQLAGPLLHRAMRILELAMAGQDVILPWNLIENRPALRLLSRQINLFLDRREDDTAARLMERIIALNPNDNHGYRCMLVNHHLHRGENERALALCDRYPDDWYNPEMSYGRALALYRLDRHDEASAVLKQARKTLPEVSRALLASNFKPPKFSEHGVTVGGKDQAAFYRDDMLETWKNTPGALDWLRQRH